MFNEKEHKTKNESEKQKNIKIQNHDQEDEIGGQKGPSPTRYGDWEKGGRCTDF